MRGFIAAVTVLSLVACGGDATSPSSASITGTFALKMINGSPLPFVIRSGENALEITADALTVADGGSWSETGRYRQTVNGVTTSVPIAEAGTWTRQGISVSFFNTLQGKVAYSGTWRGAGYNLVDASFSYTFAR